MVEIDYLSNPNEWQAFSHPDLARSKPDELFDQCFSEDYDRLQKAIWGRIIQVHGTLYTLRQLRGFPFEFLYGPYDMEFWRLVYGNFRDLACVALHGLVTDSGEDVHSIPSFKNKILKANWLCPERRDLLITTLRNLKFDDEVKGAALRVKRLRDTCIAHSLLDKNNVPMSELVKPVEMEELWLLYHAAKALFGAVSFGGAYVTLAGDLMPSTVRGVPKRTCLDKVLDGIVHENPIVNMPERKPQVWSMRRTQMTPERVGVMNDLRKRIGLPQA
jgi:hypothetical protein